MPLFHTGGLNSLATPRLHHGGRVVIVSGFDAERALQISSDERITLHMGVPTIFQLWRDAESFARADLSSTRMVLCGGALPAAARRRLSHVRHPLSPGLRLDRGRPQLLLAHAQGRLPQVRLRRLAQLYVQARIINDAGAQLPAGEVGELMLGGPIVTLGYFRNPDATAQAFRGTRWFHTGDLVRCDEEGYHHIVNRKKDMFISGGENVYPAEVELALAALDGMAEDCVIAVSDERWGQVGRAVVVAAAGARLDEKLVLRHLGSRLARYKVPRSVVFTDLLPRNPTGKILRPRVRELFGTG
jgi:fatty-acyl-CoA synthase